MKLQHITSTILIVFLLITKTQFCALQSGNIKRDHYVLICNKTKSKIAYTPNYHDMVGEGAYLNPDESGKIPLCLEVSESNIRSFDNLTLSNDTSYFVLDDHIDDLDFEKLIVEEFAQSKSFIEINYDKDGKTPKIFVKPYLIKELIDATAVGDIKKIDYVLSSSPCNNVNMQNEAGITPLMRAAQNNQVEMVTFLLSKKADPNLTDNQQMIALEWALYAHPHTSKPVQKKTKQILHELLKAGAQKTTGAYKTAVKFGYPEDILKLLKVGE